MKKIKEIKAITLVALVITIIILLILAGITISQLVGSGLFENSKLAKEKYENAQEDEETQLAKYNNKIDTYINGARDYEEEINKLKAEVEKLKNGNSYSETEKVIGTWVDGKKLYQRSLKFTGTSAETVNASDGSTGKSITGITSTYMSDVAPTIETLVSATFENNQGYEYPFHFNDSNGYISCCDNPGIEYYGLRINVGSYLTIRYTKTGNQ